MTTISITSRWLSETKRQLMRGKHVALHGNVRDLALYQGNFLPFAAALRAMISECGYSLTARYNLTDGVKFPDEETRDKFNALVAGQSGAVAPREGEVAMRRRGSPPPATATPSPSQSQPPASPDTSPTYRAPDVAMAAIRTVLNKSRNEMALVVVEFADKLFAGGENQPLDDRRLMTLIGQSASEAYRHLAGAGAGMRNALVLTAASIGQLPGWIYRDNPLFHVIHVDRPDDDARKAFFTRQYPGFYAAAGASPEPVAADEFSALTDGLSYWELEALRLTSHHEKLPVSNLRPMVDFFKHGSKDDPWEKLDGTVIRNAGDFLTRRVIGQDTAIKAAQSVLISAKGGIQLEGADNLAVRPKGVLFFVGPTGVGKTELAKAMTELIFHDPSAFARFDMSEYSQEHAAERLTGAPPSFVGYEAGGQLTNRMKLKPFSLILFDEIEKAHPKIMDKFLQVLDDGRLTDGMGETVYFSKSVIIFTSNIGSIGSRLTPDMSYENLAEHYGREVRNHFVKAGRPEILGRIGEENIIAFDMVRPQHIPMVLEKFLAGLASSAMSKYGLNVEYDPAITELAVNYCAKPETVALGYRAVRNFVQNFVRGPLNGAALESAEGDGLFVTVRKGKIHVERD